MEFTHEDLRTIVERAGTLAERLYSGFEPIGDRPEAYEIQACHDRWCSVIAGGDKADLAKRLA